MAKIGTCDLCKRDIIREEYSDFTIEGCSDFCATSTPEEKESFKTLQKSEWGVWPCSECGCAIEDEYEPGGHCSKCSDKVKLRQLNKRVAVLEKENAELNKEIQAAYKYNKEINKWWNFKMERLKLELSHGTAPKDTRSPVFCEHANECPNICPCDKSCYCKGNTCK